MLRPQPNGQKQTTNLILHEHNTLNRILIYNCNHVSNMIWNVKSDINNYVTVPVKFWKICCSGFGIWWNDPNGVCGDVTDLRFCAQITYCDLNVTLWVLYFPIATLKHHDRLSAYDGRSSYQNFAVIYPPASTGPSSCLPLRSTFMSWTEHLCLVNCIS